MKTNVYLREEKITVPINITDYSKPIIEQVILDRWQRIISLVAEILDVSAGLIMRITKTHMKVLVKSQNKDNPYPADGKDELLHGLYCETVIGRDEPLHIDNSLLYDDWKDNPDIKLNMVSYYGLPIKWADDSVFGTICVLDKETNHFHNKYRSLLLHFREIIEEDLAMLERKQYLERQSDYDTLTGLFNRKHYEEEIINIDKEKNYPLSIIVADINGLKLINDAFGNYSGDKVLIDAAEVFLRHSKNDDFVARIGGDEFIIIMPNTNKIEAEKRVDKMLNTCKTYEHKSYPLSISFGIDTKSTDSVDFKDLYRSAEDSMYRMKLHAVPSMRNRTIDTIITTLYEKDNYSESHSRKVSKMSEEIAKRCNLPYSEVNDIKTTGLLHDIGKIIIPQYILNKIGPLDDKEMAEMKKHCEIGSRILNSTSELRDFSKIILYHHEKWDGTGYPRGVKGEEIPYQARIISLADAFDAMTSDRTYREKLTPEEALEEIKRCSGTQFDPKFVKIFEDNFEEIMKSCYSVK